MVRDKRQSSSSVAFAVALGAFLLTALSADDARAFCRSTTCRTKNGQECPVDANGCPTDGAKLWWPTSCISYATNKLGTQDLDPADTRAVIKKCFEAWTEVPCPDGTISNMRFQELDPVDCKKSEYNKDGPNVNVIMFQDDNWNYRGIDGTLAKTSVTYDDETGEIFDADIEVNTANNTVTITDNPAKVEYDLQSILTHEAGHFIGLAHSPLPQAVMFASYSPGSLAQRKLDPDDIAAVCTVYPHDYEFSCNTTPRGGFSGTCDDPPKSTICSVQPGPGASYGVAGLVFGSGLVAARARRRRSRASGEQKPKGAA
jgi:Matrixin